MSEPLLQIINHHTAASGEPPSISADHPDVYLGYFENALGEQWVFTFDRSTRRGELRGGDIGWNTVHAVEDGSVRGLNLQTNEIRWLQACWQSATGSH